MNLFTVKETASKLRMSQAWVRMKIFQREIAYLKVGRRVLIPESTIEEILRRALVRPRQE